MPKVLVIEDDETIAKMVRANLTASGYRVSCAGTGEEGIQMVRTETPDVILLDVKMPGMSGWEVIDELRADPRLKDVPVIVITASLKETDEASVLATGVQALLTKPFSVNRLMMKIDQVLERREK
jgi:two-component system phosphate regulon response regulator PhoB